MERSILVPTQLSSLFPSTQATSIPIQTTRQNVSLPPAPRASDPPLEHATYSAVLHTPTTGTILLRVLHGGSIIELISLSTEVAPVRLVFPVAVLPSPAIFLWEMELHVLAVTNIGSLHRVVLPVDGNGHLWQSHIANIWTREYHIKHFPGNMQGVVHVQGTHCVAIGMPNGSLLRVETEYLVSEGNDGECLGNLSVSSFLVWFYR